MIAYYLTSCLLEKGSIILPGNWGRMLNLYVTPFNDINSPRILLRETIYENVREKLFPEKPSRLSSLFCCPTLDCANNFKIAQGRNFDVIYKIAIDDKEMFITSWIKADLPHDKSYHAINAYYEQAKIYWSIDYTQYNENELEIITPYPATILEQCS